MSSNNQDHSPGGPSERTFAHRKPPPKQTTSEPQKPATSSASRVRLSTGVSACHQIPSNGRVPFNSRNLVRHPFRDDKPITGAIMLPVNGKTTFNNVSEDTFLVRVLRHIRLRCHFR